MKERISIEGENDSLLKERKRNEWNGFEMKWERIILCSMQQSLLKLTMDCGLDQFTDKSSLWCDVVWFSVAK